MAINRSFVTLVQHWLCAALTLVALSGCSVNYSDDMRKVLVPMQDKLVNFYQEHERFPSVEERNALLTECGCKMKFDSCMYLGLKFHVENYKLFTTPATQGYNLKMALEKSRCYAGLYKNGTSLGVSCHQDSALDIGQ